MPVKEQRGEDDEGERPEHLHRNAKDLTREKQPAERVSR